MHDLRICPVDRVSQLIIIERNGIEIDYCPACRGVWLDRGELEKILETSAQMTSQAVQQAAQAPQRDPLMPPPSAYPAQPQAPQMPQPGYQQVPPAHHSQMPYGYNNSGGWKDGRRRKKGWLDDLFDFD